MQALHYFSLATALTRVLDSQGRHLSTATSFFYEGADSQLYLITNWHVVTGRDPSRPSRSVTGAVPCEIRVRLHNKQKKVGGKSSVVISEVSEISLPINSKDGNDPRWLEHPEQKFGADVVCIRIAKDLEFRKKYAFNVANKWKEYHQDYEPGAMDEVFVIGYPWGLSSAAKRGGGLPVYKRGSIASDPVVDFRRLPCVLIDCRTSSAMSGSPVIASQSGIFMPDGRMSGNTVFGTVSKFLGVYSGRLIGEESESCPEISEIGMVWKASALEAITVRGTPGTPLRELAR